MRELGGKRLSAPRGDEEFRLAVDHIYRGGEIGALSKRTFGDANPGQVLGTAVSHNGAAGLT